MSHLDAGVPDDLEEELRYIVAKRFVFKKEAIKRAVIEALRDMG